MQHVRLGGAFYSEWNNIYVQYLARPTFPHSGQASQSAPRHLQSLIRKTASHFSNTHIFSPIWYPMLQNMNHTSLPVKTLASFRSRQQQDFKGLPKIYKCSWSMWRSTTSTSEMYSPTSLRQLYGNRDRSHLKIHPLHGEVGPGQRKIPILWPLHCV